MTIKQKFSSIDQSKLTADQKAFLTKIKDVTKNFTDAEMNKKVEAPLNGFIEKAKEKMPEAIKSAPVKRTGKAKTSQTRKPKRTAMSVAKEIRKEGESWKDAQARASKMMKEDSKDLSKTVETELDKLSKLVRSQKQRAKLSGLSGTDIRRDAVRKAKPRGRRTVTRSGETTNQYGTYSNKLGRKYTENRDNRTDRLAPKYPKNAPLLADGGYLTDPNFGGFQNQVLATGGSITNERRYVNKGEDYEVRYSKPIFRRKGYQGKRDFELGGAVVTDLAGNTGGGNLGLNPNAPLDGFSNTSYTGLVGETGAMSSGEMFMAGGSVEKKIYGIEKDFLPFDFGLYTYDEAKVKSQEYMIEYPNSFFQPRQYNDMRNELPAIERMNMPILDKDGKFYNANNTPFSQGDLAEYEHGGGLPHGAEQSYMITESFGNPAQHFAKGGGVRQVGNREYSYGRNWTNDHRHINKDEEHEVKYNRKGKFLGVFNDGGNLITETANAIFYPNEKNGKINTGFGAKTKEGLLNMLTNVNYDTNEITDAIFNSNEKNGKINTGFGAKTKQGLYEIIKNMQNTFAKGGAITNERKHVNQDEDYEVRYAKPRPSRKGYKGVRSFANGGKVGDFAMGRGLDNLLEQNIINKIQYYPKGIPPMNHKYGVRYKGKTYTSNDTDDLVQKVLLETNKMSDGGMTNLTIQDVSFATGGAITNERKHVNHDEDYEVRYSKPRPSRKGYKGARKFMAGGMNNETPRIYVADLEAYNNGRLVGEWLDLSDYNDADELMDAIQDVLKKSGGEEYAIHDVEYIPRSMYSEYMGKRDFEELYEMMELADKNDLPLEVVQEIVSQFDASAVNEFVGKYDSADDFAQQLTDDLGGIQNFNDFERYLTVSETDRRLLSQEMADSYVDDIRDEDGGNRLIEEAGMDVSEYEEADSERQEEMLDKAREIVYDNYYDDYFDGMSDPYNFLVEEQGIYDAESFANASFVQVDFEDLGDALEDDYTYIFYNSDLYVFNIR